MALKEDAEQTLRVSPSIGNSAVESAKGQTGHLVKQSFDNETARRASESACASVIVCTSVIEITSGSSVESALCSQRCQ